MRRLLVFNLVSIDGYFVDVNGDMSWAHAGDQEFKEFAQGNARGGGELLFGRVTYDLMARYWPTPAARQNDPVVAEAMNSLPKVVFSRTMKKAAWTNTRVMNGDPAGSVRKMKEEPGPGMAIMGSGTIIPILAQEGLIDEYQLVVVPVVLGGGRTIFDGVKSRPRVKLTKSRVFGNGYVLLCYEPVSI